MIRVNLLAVVPTPERSECCYCGHERREHAFRGRCETGEDCDCRAFRSPLRATGRRLPSLQAMRVAGEKE